MPMEPHPPEQENACELMITHAPEGLDVHELMKEVRDLARRRGVPSDAGEISKPGQTRSHFGAEWVSTVGEDIDLLRAAATLDLQGDPIRSHRPFTGRFIIAWKKFVRFWVRKYTDSLFLRQSFFNSRVVGTLEQLRQRLETLEEEVESLRAEVARLQSTQSPRDDKKNRP